MRGGRLTSRKRKRTQGQPVRACNIGCRPRIPAGVDAAGSGDREYYFVSRGVEFGGGAIGGAGDDSVVLSVLSLPAEFLGIICAEGVSDSNFWRQRLRIFFAGSWVGTAAGVWTS